MLVGEKNLPTLQIKPQIAFRVHFVSAEGLGQEGTGSGAEGVRFPKLLKGLGFKVE